MALFSFSDISFKASTRTGGVGNNLLGADSFKYDIYRYPIDLGSVDKGHYMVIHINTQRKTRFQTSTTGDLPTIFESRQSTGNYTLGASVSRTLNKILPGISSQIEKYAFNSSSDAEAFQLGFLRTIQRSTETIALYMPDTLGYTHQQGYSDLSLSGAITAGIGAASSIADSISSGRYKEIASDGLSADSVAALIREAGGNLSPFLAGILQRYGGDLGRAAFTAYAGVVVNPMLEMIYVSPSFRDFRFDFMFYPRSEKEAKEVQLIIDRLRFHQAPEIDPAQEGFFLIPPSEFDIKFYYNGYENTNIPRISTCVLTNIDVDYAPNGFSAYEVPGENKPQMGRTGMPTAIRMSLAFKETEIMTKSNYRAGGAGRADGPGVLSIDALAMSKAWNDAGQVNEKGEGLF